uniref:Uncharacterized protein n=1 Tax=Coccolithus braarudii TaxID=221442 RepID=A0A7S0Q5D4_9EUKA|mmetsp:Transcript_39054/g.83256  ORF Transcript_39054/g.83256 Transcript_39054/m.83256 type:complete len:144 (+) Transcript_39054:973-1404(+)
MPKRFQSSHPAWRSGIPPRQSPQTGRQVDKTGRQVDETEGDTARLAAVSKEGNGRAEMEQCRSAILSRSGLEMPTAFALDHGYFEDESVPGVAEDPTEELQRTQSARAVRAAAPIDREWDAAVVAASPIVVAGVAAKQTAPTP